MNTIDTYNTHQQGIPFTPATNMSALVNQLLKKDSAYHPNLGGITKGGMSNHYPMTILSLQGLGASDEEIQHFTQLWPRHRAHITEQLQLKDKGVVNENNWQDYLGQANYLLEFRRVFLNALQNHPQPNEYILNTLYQMRMALPMGLFHPLIRISFAMIHGDKGLIADGLAYMAIRFSNLYGGSQLHPESQLTQPVRQPQETAMNSWRAAHVFIQRHGDSIEFKQDIHGGSLHICELLCSEPHVHALAFNHGMHITKDNLMERVAQISMCALRIYLHQPALTTLHGVTSCQALADITLRCKNDNTDTKKIITLWQHYWLWLTALYIEKGFPKDLPKIDASMESEIAQQDWSNLAEKARNIPEVHLIKMVYSCQWLYQNIEQDVHYKLAGVKILKERNAHPRTRYGLAK
jgi:hypothetical protein